MSSDERCRMDQNIQLTTDIINSIELAEISISLCNLLLNLWPWKECRLNPVLCENNSSKLDSGNNYFCENFIYLYTNIGAYAGDRCKFLLFYLQLIIIYAYSSNKIIIIDNLMFYMQFMDDQ